jgi:hypothetical protein
MFGLWVSPMAGGVITEFTAGTLHNTASAAYWGQSFITPTGAPWNNIRFSFVADSGPYATGTAYLLTQMLSWSVCCDPPPIVTPQSLNATAPGFIAQSTGVLDGQYIFASSVILQPSTIYYLYETGPIPAGTITGGAYLTPSGNCCTDYYSSLLSSAYFPGFGESANFILAGDPVPEPRATYLVTTGLLALLGAKFGRRRRLRK